MKASRGSRTAETSKASITVLVSTATTVVFQHFQLASLGGYPVTFGIFAGFTMLAQLVKPRASMFLVAVSAAGYAALVALASGLSGTQGIEFARTLTLVVATSAIAMWGTGYIRANQTDVLGLKKGLYISLWLVVGLAATQVVTGSTGSDLFFNPWGTFQYLYQYDPLIQFNPIPRAQGFYLEPSYLAFIVCAVSIALLLLNYRRNIVICLWGIGLMTARSATAFIVVGILLITYMLRGRVRGLLVALCAVIPLTFFVGPYLQDRLGSTAVTGSSANFRLVAPLTVISDTLSNAPLGNFLGSSKEVMATYQLLNGASAGASLDNGVYLILFYFGWTGVVLILIAICATLRNMLKSSSTSTPWVVSIWLFGSLFFSGGIFLPEFGVMTALIIICGRLGGEESSEYRSIQFTNPQYSDSNIQ